MKKLIVVAFVSLALLAEDAQSRGPRGGGEGGGPAGRAAQGGGGTSRAPSLSGARSAQRPTSGRDRGGVQAGIVPPPGRVDRGTGVGARPGGIGTRPGGNVATRPDAGRRPVTVNKSPSGSNGRTARLSSVLLGAALVSNREPQAKLAAACYRIDNRSIGRQQSRAALAKRKFAR
jgi:hypothetical protein